MSSAGAAAPERYFEDYVPGAEEALGTVELSEQEIVEFARRFDPQAFHVDPEAAKQGPFGGLVASGWHTVGAMTRLFVTRYLSPVSSLGSPGIDELRWPAPVRPGDRLSVFATVLETRPSRSKPERGLVHTLVEVRNQRGETAMSMKIVNLVRLRHAPRPA